MAISTAVVAAHCQPAPVIDTSASPGGTVSLTVTRPAVGAAPAAFATATEQVAPCWPCVKSPLCVFATLRIDD